MFQKFLAMVTSELHFSKKHREKIAALKSVGIHLNEKPIFPQYFYREIPCMHTYIRKIKKHTQYKIV